jgi:Flp pilus assembly pilin Flp
VKSLEVLVVFLSSESGQDLVEYGIAAGVIGLCAIASMKSITTAIGNFVHNLAVMESYF